MQKTVVLLLYALISIGSVYSICEIAVPHHRNFTSLVATFNTHAQNDYLLPPIEYLACSTAEEYSAYISKEERYVKFAIQGGRHSAGSFSYGGMTNVTPPYTVLSTRLLTNMSVKVNAKGDSILEIGAGVHILEVIPFLEQYTNLWFFGGSCPTVKLSGFTLSGGYTFVVRTMGMVLDVVDSMDVVLWNGTITTVSKTQNSDLFWGLLGAGSVGRFAFVTTFRFILSLAPPSVTVVDYEWAWNTNSSTAVSFLQLWNHVAPSMDPRCSMSLGIVGGASPNFNMRGMCVCDAETARQLLEPFLSNSSVWPAPTATRAVLYDTDWVNGSYYLDGCFTEEGCLEAAHRDPHENPFKDGSNGWKEDCFFGYGELSSESWAKILAVTRRMCEGSEHLCGTLMTPDGQNSHQCTHPEDTAFPREHRCATFHVEFLVHLNTSRQAATQAQTQRYASGLTEMLRVDRDRFRLEPYAGYVDKDFCETYAEDGRWAMMMYAQNFTHVHKLCDVRCKYDPEQVALSPCSFDFCYC